MQELISFFMTLGLSAEDAARMALDHISPVSEKNARGTQLELERLMQEKYAYPPELAKTISTNTVAQPINSPYRGQLNEAIRAPQARQDSFDRASLQALAEQETRRLGRSNDPSYLKDNVYAHLRNTNEAAPVVNYDPERDPEFAKTFAIEDDIRNIQNSGR